MTQISESGTTQFSGEWLIDHQIEELKAQVNELKIQIVQANELKADYSRLKADYSKLEADYSVLKAEKSEWIRINRELQWRVDPWSSEGEAICNSD